MLLQIHNHFPTLQKGFSLIELMVVIVIMGTLVSIAVPSFLTYNNLQSLQSATSDLSSTLETAKARADSQIKPAGCTNSLLGYQVDIPANATNQYSLEALCSGSPSSVIIPIATHTFPQNVSFGTTSGTARIYLFKVLHQGVVSSGDITLKQGSSSNTSLISVDKLGVIDSSINVTPSATPTSTPVVAPTATPTPVGAPTATPTPTCSIQRYLCVAHVCIANGSGSYCGQPACLAGC